MNFRAYWHSLPTGEPRSDFARRCGSTVGYFNLLASGHKKAGPDLAIRIEAESARTVTVEELCPDVPWHVIRGGGTAVLAGSPADTPAAGTAKAA